MNKVTSYWYRISRAFTVERSIFVGLMLIAVLAHSVNMFHYPYFENDEATYVSQAWAWVAEGKLAPYTYYYDHAPVGWMFLGIWFFLTGGLDTFGANPLLSGRVFMLLLQVCSVAMLYAITKRITRQTLAATLAVLVFILSPLQIYYGRRVLLDNIMVFWVLASLFFATKTPQKLRYVLLSGLAFGLAALSKENAVFMGPAILYTIWIYASERIRWWSVGKWLISAGGLIALYPLYAALKGELLPALANERVSLIETLMMQSSRGQGGFPWQTGSDFYTNLVVWLERDPWFILAGTVALLASLILNEKYREIKAIAWTAVAQILFLTRGALVFDFYILGVLPLLAMLIGIMLAKPLVWAKDHISPWGYSFITCLIVVIIFLTSGNPAFYVDETTNQQQAIDWVVENVPQDSYLAVNNYAFPQLRYVEGYQRADFSFKLQFDPSVQEGIYHSNPYQVDYLLVTHAEITHLQQGNLPFVQESFDHSQLVADFRQETSSYIDIEKLISTNGDWAQVYRLDDPGADIITHSWRTYKRRFMEDDGQVIDLDTWTTTSEGQSYAMLRALEHNDKVTFDLVWDWTQEHLQVREDDALFAWRIRLDEQGHDNLDDINAATDADQDIAYALYQAYQVWGDESYLEAAKTIVADIWQHGVTERNGRYYLLAAPDEADGRRLLINPSYISPFYYRIFVQLDDNPWLTLIDDSYKLIDEVKERSRVGLVSNWIFVEQDGSLSTASRQITQGADSYGYDAFRFAWRMRQDIQDSRAEQNLFELAEFYQSSWSNYGYIASQYDLFGEPISDFSDISTSAGAVIALSWFDPLLAETIYQEEIVSKLDPETYHWGRDTDYYAQNWAAFSYHYLQQSHTAPGSLVSSE